MGFSERFPRWITLLIGLAQLLITAAIIGLELVSCYIDLAHGTIWVGLWAGIVFIATFLATLFITCCCRGRYCAFYVFVLNIFSGALASVVIYFDQIFMKNLCTCYLGNQICCALQGVSTLQSNYSNVLQTCGTALISGNISALTCPSVPTGKLIYIEVQLGCAAGMLLACAIYIVVFLFACCGVCFGHGGGDDDDK